MEPKFNINRPRVSDDEIKRHQDFDKLVKQFKEQSLKKAQGDESWRKNKKIQYSAIIAGITVVCTVTYFSLIKNQKQKTKHETLTTQASSTSKKSETNTPLVSPPSKNSGMPYTDYVINAAKPSVINHPTGTKIKVPQHAFTNKQGQIITGDVTIQYREFHDLTDVIFSGIPMNYDSAGIKRQFESAGMFDIKAHQNGEPVYINTNGNIKVELASANTENKFNQYYLDTIGRQWQYIGADKLTLTENQKNTTLSNKTDAIATDKKINALHNQIEKIIPQRMDSIKTTYTQKIELLPRAAEPLKPVKQSPGKATFVIDGSKEDFPELAAFHNVVFEVGSENKNYRNEFKDITWSDVKISQGPVKGKNYLLTLTKYQRKEQLIVYPVLSDGDYDQAMVTYTNRLKLYEEKKEKRLADEQRLMAEMNRKQAILLELQKKQEAELKKERELKMTSQKIVGKDFDQLSAQNKAIRLFELTRFGIYNSDCAKPVQGSNTITPVFVLNGQPVFPQCVYIVNHTAKTALGLASDNGFTFSFNTDDNYSLCVFRKDKLYLCNKESFNQSAVNNQNKFQVSPLPEGNDEITALRKALEL